uniref:Uncharacterized protein n=1 Tax=Caenorhabditis japonica TaxID=281687 RepID=A0A8R1IRU8_CAEJA
MNLDGERVWSVATDDYFSQISEERAFAKSSGELDRNEIAELIVKITNPKATRYSENSLCWKDVKMSKNILSFDFFDRVEKMVPFHVLTSIETHLTVELEKMVNAVTHETAHSFFSGPVYQKLVKTIQTECVPLAATLAQIGQFILLLCAITNSKRMASRLKEDQTFRDLSELSKYEMRKYQKH